MEILAITTPLGEAQNTKQQVSGLYTALGSSPVYGRLISEIIEHDSFEFFLNYAEQAVLSTSFHLGDPDSDIRELVSRSKAAGYALIPEVQKKSYSVYMASKIMESIILDISETTFRFESNDDCE